MKFAIFLQHYFPYGGLQRDALRLAEAGLAAGDLPTLVVSTWDGPKPEEINVVELNSGGKSNHTKVARFADACRSLIAAEDFDTSICFSRVPGSPFHFCGDSCFLEKFQAHKPAILQWLPRYRFFLKNELDLFGPQSKTHIFFLAATDRDSYRQHYQVAENRCTLLPPWLQPSESLSKNRETTRKRIDHELKIAEGTQLLLFVGSNFKLKRVARIIDSLPLLNDNIHLAICGDDSPAAVIKQTKSLGIEHRVHVMGPRDDIPAWMSAADLLVHPSSRETAGMVLVEALTYGLPVTCTQLCGYANHVADAGGSLLSNDCPPEEIARTIIDMLGRSPSLREQALAWAANPDLYHTADIILNRMRDSLLQNS